MLTTGLSATKSFVVRTDDTAESVGSGSLPVLGTPRLLGWMEQVTCRAVDTELERGTTTVGTRMVVEHTAPSPVGESVEVTATLGHVDGRLLRFQVGAQDSRGKVVASGEITRVVVNSDRFRSRLG